MGILLSLPLYKCRFTSVYVCVCFVSVFIVNYIKKKTIYVMEMLIKFVVLFFIRLNYSYTQVKVENDNENANAMFKLKNVSTLILYES